MLPFDHFMFSEMTMAENEQRLRAVFVTHEVVIRGTGMRRIETALQRIELSHLAVLTGSRSLIAEGQPTVHEIIITARNNQSAITASDTEERRF